MKTCALCKRERDDDQLMPFGYRQRDDEEDTFPDLRCCINGLNRAQVREQVQTERREQAHLQAKERATAQAAQRAVGGTCSLCGRTFRDAHTADGRQRDSGLLAFGEKGARRCADAAGCASRQEQARRHEHERQVELRTAAALRERKTPEPLRLSRTGGLGW